MNSCYGVGIVFFFILTFIHFLTFIFKDPPHLPIDEISADDFRKLFDLNVLGYFFDFKSNYNNSLFHNILFIIFIVILLLYSCYNNNSGWD